MEEQIKVPKIKLSNKETDKLSDTEFKTLEIRMLTEMIEYGRKIEAKVKAMPSETKENIQETNREGKETGTQINNMEQKEERNIQPEQDEEKIILKNEERLRSVQDNFKHSNVRIIGVPERDEEKQETENLFEKIMKENFPNLMKEIDI